MLLHHLISSVCWVTSFFFRDACLKTALNGLFSCVSTYFPLTVRFLIFIMVIVIISLSQKTNKWQSDHMGMEDQLLIVCWLWKLHYYSFVDYESSVTDHVLTMKASWLIICWLRKFSDLSCVDYESFMTDNLLITKVQWLITATEYTKILLKTFVIWWLVSIRKMH